MEQYSELLKHPLWQKKRLKILRRDNFQCQLCTDKDSTLNVHHLKYISGRKPWEYRDENLITLCWHCHDMISFLGLNEKETKQFIKSNIPFLKSPYFSLSSKQKELYILTIGVALLKKYYKPCPNDSLTLTNTRSPL